MKILKSTELEVGPEDNFLYDWLINLFQQIKIIQGGTELAYTLRNHPKLKNYCIAKQRDRINTVEQDYFTDIGMLKFDAVQNYHQKKSLQK